MWRLYKPNPLLLAFALMIGAVTFMYQMDSKYGSAVRSPTEKPVDRAEEAQRESRRFYTKEMLSQLVEVIRSRDAGWYEDRLKSPDQVPAAVPTPALVLEIAHGEVGGDSAKWISGSPQEMTDLGLELAKQRFRDLKSFILLEKIGKVSVIGSYKEVGVPEALSGPSLEKAYQSVIVIHFFTWPEKTRFGRLVVRGNASETISSGHNSHGSWRAGDASGMVDAERVAWAKLAEITSKSPTH